MDINIDQTLSVTDLILPSFVTRQPFKSGVTEWRMVPPPSMIGESLEMKIEVTDELGLSYEASW